MQTADSIELNCPYCKRKLLPAHFMRYAKQVVDRTCKCGIKFRIKVEPLRAKPPYMHKVTYRVTKARKDKV